jgi:hypothetical protein
MIQYHPGGRGRQTTLSRSGFLRTAQVLVAGIVLYGSCLGPTISAQEAATSPVNGPRELTRTNLLQYSPRNGEVAPVRNETDWNRRRSAILQAMTSVTGPLPGIEARCPLDVRTEEETNEGTFVRRRITYAAEPGSRVPAWLMIPNQADRSTDGFPAVLALHPTDMEYGNRVVVEALRPYYPPYGRELVERGFVVLAPAYPLMADYQPDLRKLGYQSGTMKAIWDNLRGLDVLESLPFVRRAGFGAIGHSLGGHNAIFTAVFDPRIRVVVSSCGFDSFCDYMNGDLTGWTSDRYMPGLRQFRGHPQDVPFDFYELLGAVAPRELLISAPLGDSNFKSRSVDAVARAAHSVYALCGTPGALRVLHPDCGHEFPFEIRQESYRLLAASLSHLQAVPSGAGTGTDFPNGVTPAVEGPSPNSPRGFGIETQADQASYVRPNGEKFFSLGACCVNLGTPLDQLSRTNRSYSGLRHYPDAARWGMATSRRLKAWGFTTAGGWSDFQALNEGAESWPELAFTPVLHMGASAGLPWWDMWDPKNVQRMEEIARDQILAIRDDPRLMGYYSDNELGWWNAALFKMTLEQPSTSGQRRRLLELLKRTYRNNWELLAKDFDGGSLTSWEQLERSGLLYLRPEGDGIRAVQQFVGLLADRYYFLTREIIRKYDRRGLLLGDRYQSFFYPEVARAAARYVDAVSSNVNAPWSEGSLPRFYLETLHALSGKPIQVGEFYLAARQNRSGNRNSHGAYPLVKTQRERAAGFATTLRSLANYPYVVGADWFQYYDEPTNGRADGEDYNFGLVDIYDRPYQPLVDTAARLDAQSLRLRSTPAVADASMGVPPAPQHPLGRFRPTLALEAWDRERGFVPPNSEFPLADLYVCWTADALYLGVYAQDIIEPDFYPGGRLPAVARAQWQIRIPDRQQPVNVRLGGGLKPTLSESTAQLASLSSFDIKVHTTAALGLPARLFGRKEFRTGDRVEFSSAFVTHSKAHRTSWSGSFILASARYEPISLEHNAPAPTQGTAGSPPHRNNLQAD